MLRNRNSQAIVERAGAQKVFRYNPDMGFIIVPPDQKRVDVKIVSYPDESDKGPFPVPANVTATGAGLPFSRKLV